MAASFIPPTTDLGATAVPPISAVAPSTSTSASEPEPEAHTIPAVPGQPRPVAPAEEIGVPPAKALDPLAEPSILDKAREVTKPYITKIQETTKPYLDAAEHKADELMNKLEGSSVGGAAFPPTVDGTPAPAASTAPYAAGPGARSAPAGTDASAGEIGEKAKHFFEQGLATVSSTFNQLTHTIDEKTKSDTHPGIVTQATTAFEKGVNKVDDFLNEKTATPQVQPVQTTTNTVPHPEGSAASKPVV